MNYSVVFVCVHLLYNFSVWRTYSSTTKQRGVEKSKKRLNAWIQSHDTLLFFKEFHMFMFVTCVTFFVQLLL